MAIYASETLLSLLLKGGWLMLPFALLSLAMVYIIVERFLVCHKYLRGSGRVLEALEGFLHKGDLEQVDYFCSQEAHLIQKVLSKGIHQSKSKHLELILKNESEKYLSILEENLSWLATIAGVAPMIGFLGTVIGMVQTFMAIAQEKNQVSAEIFSSGIYEAMITTVAGLIVGIIAYMGYNYFVARINQSTKQLAYLINLFLTKTIVK
ncbi:MAG: MotA/TolQ/ExbB proton channel family protein [Amoebophilaceae bacterium]|nr:MotA/TolQ/ExbB proton channel family protein [Amoebophilaceae bacterium]